MALFDLLKKSTKVFDPSDNKVVIAGMTVDGVVEASVIREDKVRTLQGTSGSYRSLIRKHDSPATFSMTVLSTSVAVKKLNQLAYYCLEFGNMFDLTIINNGETVLQGIAWFQRLPNEKLSDQAEDIGYSLGVNISYASGERGLNTGLLDLSDFESTDLPELGEIF